MSGEMDILQDGDHEECASLSDGTRTPEYVVVNEYRTRSPSYSRL